MLNLTCSSIFLFITTLLNIMKLKINRVYIYCKNIWNQIVQQF